MLPQRCGLPAAIAVGIFASLASNPAPAGPFPPSLAPANGSADAYAANELAGNALPGGGPRARGGRDAIDTREADSRGGKRASAMPFQAGGPAYAFGGPTTGMVAFDPAAPADGPAGAAPCAPGFPLTNPYVPVIRRQIRASLQAGSLTGSGALYRSHTDARDALHEASFAPAAAANAAAAGGVFLNIGDDALRVEVLSLDDTPFGQWLTLAQSEAAEGVSSFYTDLAGDFLGARRVGNPRTIIYVPDVRPAVDDSEPSAYTLPDAVSFDVPFVRPAPGMSTILASPSANATPMFQRHYTGPAPKRQDAQGTEIPAGEGVEALPMGVMQNVFRWGQAHPILAGLIAGFFAVVTGTIVAKNPGRAPTDD